MNDEQIIEEITAQAIRAYGPEIGKNLGASCKTLPIETQRALRDGWKAEADAKGFPTPKGYCKHCGEMLKPNEGDGVFCECCYQIGRRYLDELLNSNEGKKQIMIRLDLIDSFEGMRKEADYDRKEK